MDVYGIARLVREHSVRAEVRDGVVWGEAVFSLPDRSVGREWERIGTTRRAALIWLGY